MHSSPTITSHRRYPFAELVAKSFLLADVNDAFRFAEPEPPGSRRRSVRLTATIQFGFVFPLLTRGTPMTLACLRFAPRPYPSRLPRTPLPNRPRQSHRAAPVTQTAPVRPPGTSTRPKSTAADQILIDFVTSPTGFLNEKAFTKGQYKLVRAEFTKYFERDRALLPSLSASSATTPNRCSPGWTSEPGGKGDAFTAIDPANEELAKVMKVFRDLWKADPKLCGRTTSWRRSWPFRRGRAARRLRLPRHQIRHEK